MMNKLASVNRLVLTHSLHSNIKRLAISTRKTTMKTENSKGRGGVEKSRITEGLDSTAESQRRGTFSFKRLQKQLAKIIDALFDICSYLHTTTFCFLRLK